MYARTHRLIKFEKPEEEGKRTLRNIVRFVNIKLGEHYFGRLWCLCIRRAADMMISFECGLGARVCVCVSVTNANVYVENVLSFVMYAANFAY